MLRFLAAIGSLLGFIDHLSNETNTLSINASIQAVSAGSSGREFTVVASEIRKLADLALDSTKDIKRLIEEIQESSRATLGATLRQLSGQGRGLLIATHDAEFARAHADRVVALTA